MANTKKAKLGRPEHLPALAILAASLVIPIPLRAQEGAVLEEIVVTAQRREQALREVPISIETVSGQEILEQGFRDMDDLADFSPSVLINPNHLRNSITVRGFGASTADGLTIEQSAPTFVDGVHFGRTNMIKLAFLDVERVEVLKGPQPVYFGQNAISGAFNITSRKPTPEWEGYVDAEFGSYSGVDSFGKFRADAAVGGPITDTLGIRVAGRIEKDDGYLINILARNETYPKYEDRGGRVILRWNPNDSFQATGKLEVTSIDKDAEGPILCYTDGLIGEVTPGISGVPIYHDALWADPPKGLGWNGEHLPIDYDCFEGNKGRASDGPFYAPPNYVLNDGRTLIVDMREFGDQLWQELYGVDMTDGFEKLDTTNTYLDLEYTLGNGIIFSSLSAYSVYERTSNRENRNTPILQNIQYRDEKFDSISQEFRLTSPAEGQRFEWMLGAYYQKTNQGGLQDMARGNIRRSRRKNVFEEDAEWTSVFGTMSFNISEEISLDVGVRVTDYEKVTGQRGWGARWLLDDGTPEGFAFPWRTRITDPTHPLNASTVIGVLPWVPNDQLNDSEMGGPYDDIVNPKARDSGTETDPQIVLRYRPTENHSVYAKYATSFKAGGADTQIAFVNADPDEFEFLPEFATIYEIGSKGVLWDGRVRYSISAFYQEIKDLQIASTTPSTDNFSLSFGNAGKQSATGMEISFDIAATDRLTLNTDIALLDSVMDEFVSTCTPVEFQNAATTGCYNDEESIAEIGTTDLSGLIDRSGEQSANAPKWKIVQAVNYEMPVLDDRFVLRLKAQGFYSDGYLTNPLTFSRVVSYDRHGDLNLLATLGDNGENWTVGVYARNLFEHRETFHPEEVIQPEGIQSTSIYPNGVRQWGLKFEYNYR